MKFLCILTSGFLLSTCVANRNPATPPVKDDLEGQQYHDLTSGLVASNEQVNIIRKITFDSLAGIISVNYSIEVGVPEFVKLVDQFDAEVDLLNNHDADGNLKESKETNAISFIWVSTDDGKLHADYKVSTKSNSVKIRSRFYYLVNRYKRSVNF